jgi:ABC-type Fe3+ transport system substrate-binding protein
MAKRLAAAIGLLAMLAIPARAETIDQLYAKAKSEGALSLYGGGPAAQYEAKAKEFEQRFPGIKVQITGGFSNEVDAKIDQEIKSGKVEVDLTVLQTLQDFARWKKEGALLVFKPEGFDKIDKSFKDAAGTFVSVGIHALPYAYNTDLVKGDDIPKRAPDFLKPGFRGKFIATYPQDNDVTLYTFYLIIRKYGWSYLDKLKAQQPNFVQGHLGVVRSIAAGQNLVTFDGSNDSQLELLHQGKPMGIGFSTIDPTPIWPLMAAIFKQAPHPNAAKLYLTWMLSREQQAQIGTWSSRSDVAPPEGLKPVFAYKVANGYMAFITDATLVASLRRRFAEWTGPIVNKGGIR